MLIDYLQVLSAAKSGRKVYTSKFRNKKKLHSFSIVQLGDASRVRLAGSVVSRPASTACTRGIYERRISI